MSLLDANQSKIWLNVKNGTIQRPFKKEDGSWDHTEHPAIEGHIVDFETVEKKDAVQKPFKELQVHIVDDAYYVLTCRLFKPFADGLLLSLANTDLNKSHRITPYKGKESGPGMNPPTYCSVRVKGEDETVKWIGDAPETKYEDNGDGVTALRKERNEFMLELIKTLKEKVKENKSKYTVQKSEESSTDPEEFSQGSLD